MHETAVQIVRNKTQRWLVACLALMLCAAGASAATPAPAPPESELKAAVQAVEAGNLGPATEALLALEARRLPAGVRNRVELLLGLLLGRQGRGEEAVPRLEQAAAGYPLLADYALFALAAIHRDAGRHAEAAGALQRLLDIEPTSVFAERASRKLPREYLEADDLPRAEQAAGKYLETYTHNGGRAAVWVTLGEVLLYSGRVEQAEQVFRRVWVELPASPESRQAKAFLDAIPTAPPLTPDEQFLRAATLYQQGQFGQALKELAPFAEADNPHEAQARFFLGMSAFRLRQYSPAAQWLEPLVTAGTGDQVEALYWLARSFGRADDAEKFSQFMLRLVDEFPQSRRADDALYLLGQAATDNGDIAAGRTYLARLLAEYPKTSWKETALWLQGWLAYEAQDLPAALASWDRLLTEEAGSRLRAQALFWKGRVLEKLQQPAGATEAYRAILRDQFSQYYYQLRALERLMALAKENKIAKKKAELPAAATKAAPPKGKPVDELHAQKARALRGLGLDDEAADEYSEEARTSPENRAALAEACGAFLDLERYDKAVWLGTRILLPLYVQEGGRPPIRGFWQCLYPLGHIALIRQQAKRLDLDPFFVTALIREESAFAPQAVSQAGARGLMQLMPQTARRVAKDNNLPMENPPPLHTPEVNIRLGMIHLAELLRDNNGNLALTLAAYNAGTQAVRRWLDRYGFSDEAEFIENIPYSETRNYVKRVLGTYEQYTRLYGSSAAAGRAPGVQRREQKAGALETGRKPGRVEAERRAPETASGAFRKSP